MKKMLIIIILIVIIVCCFLYNNPICYNTDYWHDIGIGNVHLYSVIQQDKGNPKNIRYIGDTTIVEYDGINFVWYNKQLRGVFARVEITNPSVKIGRKKLCVGVEAQKVKEVYNSLFIEELYDLPKEYLGYIDKNIYVRYKINQQNQVETIIISTGI